LRSYPPRHLAFSQYHDSNWYAGGGYAWDVVRRDAKVRESVNAWLSAPDRLQTPYELILRELIGIDQLEEPLLEGLERINEEGLDVEHEIDEDQMSSSWPVIKDPEAEAIRLRKLIQASEIDKLHELIMIDRRSNTVVSHRDVGIGVSQVLPVLVSAYASKDHIIAIEQPEIHLHPALQSDLGDVFIESALGANQNAFIIETHSEHLMLRILRRIRETSNGELPEGMSPVHPEDISVVYVQPQKTGSTVIEIPVTPDGDFAVSWPRGFFAERAKELFG
jgi:hypothetical protein